MAIGHGKTNLYLHGIEIIETPTCHCGTRDQNTDHLLFEFELLKKWIAIIKHTRIK